MLNPKPLLLGAAAAALMIFLFTKFLREDWILGVWILSSSDFGYSYDDDDLFKTLEILPISLSLSLSL
jgi:hypothetical protein